MTEVQEATKDTAVAPTSPKKKDNRFKPVVNPDFKPELIVPFTKPTDQWAASNPYPANPPPSQQPRISNVRPFQGPIQKPSEVRQQMHQSMIRPQSIVRPQATHQNVVRPVVAQQSMVRPLVPQKTPPTHLSDGTKILLVVRSIWSYTAQMQTELTFKENDVFAVIRQQPDGWWFAELLDPQRRKRGLIPGNYMKPV